MKKGYVCIILMIAHISMAESIDPSLQNSYSSWNQSLDVGISHAGNDKNYSELESGISTNKYTDSYKIGNQYSSSYVPGTYEADKNVGSANKNWSANIIMDKSANEVGNQYSSSYVPGTYEADKNWGSTNKDWGANIITMDKSANKVGNQYSDSLSLGSGSYLGSGNKSWTDTGGVEGGISYSTLSKSNLTREQMKNLKMNPPASSKQMSQPASSSKTTPSPAPYNNYARKEESRKLAEQKRKAPRPALPSQPTMSQSSQQMQSMRPGAQMSRQDQILAERRKQQVTK
ncbi:MAG: hypothetical protein FJX03_05555 [Alphaproteobacteria bacterium]|nr:hypothetical protein [Alphaproteobacteria bacterium]